MSARKRRMKSFVESVSGSGRTVSIKKDFVYCLLGGRIWKNGTIKGLAAQNLNSKRTTNGNDRSIGRIDSN